MRELSVVGLTPRSCAAPFSPATFHSVDFRAAMILLRSSSSSSLAVRTRWTVELSLVTAASHRVYAFGQSAVEIEPAVARRNHGALNDVLQFAHVARPAIGLEPAHAIV